ncbi:membrane protein [Gordonia phage Survivors]|uniref:Membrane protein n=1 Tax=Gordonia phage Azira TaxID=3035369 RepID=A0AAF0K229_9CAUD|nr:membrane protein [Gordonia phage Azira]UVK59637.1 membrane protein [Gordonia phage Survivors]WGH21069.1 membrane protein [Gordonia phage Azira]
MIEIILGALAIVAVLAGALSANYQLKQERKRTNDLARLDAEEQAMIDLDAWYQLGLGDKALKLGQYRVAQSREAILKRRNKVWPVKKKSRWKSSGGSWWKTWGSRQPNSRTVIRSMSLWKR